MACRIMCIPPQSISPRASPCTICACSMSADHRSSSSSSAVVVVGDRAAVGAAVASAVASASVSALASASAAAAAARCARLRHACTPSSAARACCPRGASARVHAAEDEGRILYLLASTLRSQKCYAQMLREKPSDGTQQPPQCELVPLDTAKLSAQYNVVLIQDRSQRRNFSQTGPIRMEQTHVLRIQSSTLLRSMKCAFDVSTQRECRHMTILCRLCNAHVMLLYSWIHVDMHIGFSAPQNEPMA